MGGMAKAEAKAPGQSSARVTTLKQRGEYQRVRKGARWVTGAFVLEAKQRSAEDAKEIGLRSLERGVDQPRFGFTVTRQIGKAVDRNRIRRRLKAAVGRVAGEARGDFDYVLIARRPALTEAFATLAGDLARGLAHVHKPVRHKPSGAAARRR